MSDKNNYMEEPSEEMTVTLTLDDGSELECVVLTVFEAGGRDYIALLPTEDPEDGVKLLHFFGGAEDELLLEPIADDQEYQEAASAFEDLFNGNIPVDLFDEEENEDE